MFKNYLKCSFDCKSYETKLHIFEEYTPIFNNLGIPKIVKLNKTFRSIEDQCEIIGRLFKIYSIRKKMHNNILPGEAPART